MNNCILQAHSFIYKDRVLNGR